MQEWCNRERNLRNNMTTWREEINDLLDQLQEKVIYCTLTDGVKFDGSYGSPEGQDLLLGLCIVSSSI